MFSFFRKPKTSPTLQLGTLLSGLWADDKALIALRKTQVQALLAAGADPNGLYGKARIWHLAFSQPLLLKILLENGADVSTFGETPFSFEGGPTDGISRQAEGSDPSDDQQNEASRLMTGSLASMKLLLEHGLDPNVEHEGETLLHYLWQLYDEANGKFETRETLVMAIEAGADPKGLFKAGRFKPYAPSVWMDRLLEQHGQKEKLVRKSPKDHIIQPRFKRARLALAVQKWLA